MGCHGYIAHRRWCLYLLRCSDVVDVKVDDSDDDDDDDNGGNVRCVHPFTALYRCPQH